MPHDKFGRLIEVGDIIKAPAYNHCRSQEPRVPVIGVGVVINMRSGQSCSGDFTFKINGAEVTDAFGAEEAEIILKKDGAEPVVPTLEKKEEAPPASESPAAEPAQAEPPKPENPA